MNKKPSSKPNSTENSENKDGKVRKKKVKKENAVDEAKNDIPVIIESDTPALDNSVKQDVKKDSEAKKKNKKPKESKESKLSKRVYDINSHAPYGAYYKPFFLFVSVAH